MKPRTRSPHSSRSGRRRPAVSPSSRSDSFSTADRTLLTSNTSQSDTSIDPGHSLFRSQPHSPSPGHPSLPYRHPVPDASSVNMTLRICAQSEQHRGLFATQSPKPTNFESPDSEADSATSLIVSRHSPASSPLPQWSTVVEERKNREKKKEHRKHKKNRDTEPSTVPAVARMYGRAHVPSTPHVQMGGPPTYYDHHGDEFGYQTPAPTPPTYDPSDLSHVGAASWHPIAFPYPPDLLDADVYDVAD